MSNIAKYPLEDSFETTLSQSWDGATGAINVNSTPNFTFPSGVTTYIVVNPGKTNQQVAEVNAYDSSAKTITVNSISVNKNAGNTYSQQSHAVGSKLIISDNFAFWEDIATAINSKLDDDGSNTTTTWDLDLSGSDFRIRKDGNDMKFTDDNTAEVTLTTLASASGADQKVSITASDTTEGLLDAKLTAGDGLSKTTVNPGGAEVMDLDVDTTDTTIFVKTSSGAGDEDKVPVLDASGDLADGFIPSSMANKTFTGTTAIDVGSDAEGDILYRDSSGDLERLAVGTAGQHLVVNDGATAPQWVDTCNSGTTSKALADATTTQDIAHGLSAIPTKVQFVFSHSGNNSLNTPIGHGVWDGTNDRCIGQTGTGGSTTITLQTGTSMIWKDSYGDGQTATVSAVDATNFTISWTKVGGGSNTDTLAVVRIAEV